VRVLDRFGTGCDVRFVIMGIVSTVGIVSNVGISSVGRWHAVDPGRRERGVFRPTRA